MKIIKNTIITALGVVLPMLFAVALLPNYIKTIGDFNYGIITVVWLVVGYMGLFDVGLARGVSSGVLNKKKEKDFDGVARILWSALAANFALSILLTVIVALAAFFLKMLYGINEEQKIIFNSVIVIAFWLPFVTGSGVLNGYLEAYDDYKYISINQSLVQISTIVLPLTVAKYITLDLSYLLSAVCLSRLAGELFMMRHICRISEDSNIKYLNKNEFIKLIKYSGWISSTAAVGPLMEMMDRVIVAFVCGPSIVTYYAAPYGILSRVRIIPAAFVKASFARLSIMQKIEAATLASNISIVIAATVGIFTICAVPIIKYGIKLWLGAEFEEKSRGVSEFILLSMWVNCIAWMPVALMQAQGFPKRVTIASAVQIVPFALFLIYMASSYGIVGAAIALSIRSLLDLMGMMFLSKQKMVIVYYVVAVYFLISMYIFNLKFHVIELNKTNDAVLALVMLIAFISFSHKSFKNLTNQSEAQ